MLTVVLLAAIAAAGALAAWRHLRAAYAVAAILAGIWLVALVLTGSAGHGLEAIGLADGLLVIVLIYLLVEAFGLPRSVADRLKIGRRSREWEFDRALRRAVEPFNRIMAEHPGVDDIGSYERWRARLLRETPRIARRIRRLHAPTTEWRSLADRYADLSEEVAAAYREGRDPSDRVLTAGASLLAERDRLRQAYRAGASHVAGDRLPD